MSPVQVVIQAALDRGYLTQSQVDQALATSLQGGSDLLPRLRPLLTPQQVAELSTLYQRAQGSLGGDDERPTARLSAAEGDERPTAPLGSTHLVAEQVTADGKRRLGPYVIERELARGGMGVVSVAFHAELERRVALKEMLPEVAEDPANKARFFREAEVVAKLNHPHVVRVYDAGEDAGRPYMALDLVEGESLEERLERDGPMDPAQAATWIAQAARGVAAAHAKGILHRDLKPPNILVDQEGKARVTDFGIARLVSDGQNLTRTGELLGSPAFMPPEQASGEHEQVDERVDVYALGATLYALLAGRAPYLGESAINIVTQVLQARPPRPSKLRAGLPMELETIVLKCMEKEKQHRYRGATQLADDLERFLRGEPIRARPPGKVELLRRWCRRHRIAVALGIFGGLVVGGLGVFDATRTEAPALTLDAPPQGVLALAPEISGRVQAGEGAGLRIERAGAAAQEVTLRGDGSFSVTLALAEGAQEVTLIPHDGSGREGAPHVMRLTLDTTAPSGRFDPVPGDVSSTVSLLATLSEPGCEVEVGEDSPLRITREGDQVVVVAETSLGLGPQRLRLRDPAGNEGELWLPLQVSAPGAKHVLDATKLPPGGRLALQAGNHELALEVASPIVIDRADPAAEAAPVIVPTGGRPALTVRSSADIAGVHTEVLVRGVHLLAREDLSAPTVWVAQGAARFEDCRILGSGTWPALLADPGELHFWSLQDIRAEKDARKEARKTEGSQPLACARGYFCRHPPHTEHSPRDGPEVHLVRCVIPRRYPEAVAFCHARGSMVDCQVPGLAEEGSIVRSQLLEDKQSRAGVDVREAWVDLVRCIVSKSFSRGVRVGGLSSILRMSDDCRVDHHHDEGVMADDGGRLELRRSRVEENNNDGVFITGHATAVIEDCVVSNNGNLQGAMQGLGGADPNHGLHLRDASREEVLIRRCRLEGNGASGLRVNDSLVRVEETHATGNKQFGVSAVDVSTLVLQGCTLAKNGVAGLLVGNDPLVQVRGGSILENGKASILLGPTGRVDVDPSCRNLGRVIRARR